MPADDGLQSLNSSLQIKAFSDKVNASNLNFPDVRCHTVDAILWSAFFFVTGHIYNYINEATFENISSTSVCFKNKVGEK